MFSLILFPTLWHHVLSYVAFGHYLTGTSCPRLQGGPADGGERSASVLDMGEWRAFRVVYHGFLSSFMSLSVEIKP